MQILVDPCRHLAPFGDGPDDERLAALHVAGGEDTGHARGGRRSFGQRDVALFAIKGLSTQEIASLRNTAEGTVKAQTNAIYRKAGVSGRPQLLSLFIEDLMEERPSESEQVRQVRTGR